MKKLLLVFSLFLVAVCSSAQVMRSEELEKYAKDKYTLVWTI